ncbi:hypothetical protein B0O80DRAFT_142995 [Mortierella sp. GBAus27b]|nr:hypothetical protein B0O80DRAFT_222437 [Mortierella sp. GBAus27b]KAI8349898.1 hypothetical protein B0O80DRAFT_142995 [Mortierella sp. GBAus27b]
MPLDNSWPAAEDPVPGCCLGGRAGSVSNNTTCYADLEHLVEAYWRSLHGKTMTKPSMRQTTPSFLSLFHTSPTPLTPTRLQRTMTNAGPTGDCLQEVQGLTGPCSTAVNNSTIFIASRLDRKTGERIVLWRDMQKVIMNADHIMCGITSIGFMMGYDFEEESSSFHSDTTPHSVPVPSAQGWTNPPKRHDDDGMIDQGVTSFV